MVCTVKEEVMGCFCWRVLARARAVRDLVRWAWAAESVLGMAVTHPSSRGGNLCAMLSPSAASTTDAAGQPAEKLQWVVWLLFLSMDRESCKPDHITPALRMTNTYLLGKGHETRPPGSSARPPL